MQIYNRIPENPNVLIETFIFLIKILINTTLITRHASMYQTDTGTDDSECCVAGKIMMNQTPQLSP